MSGMKTGHFMHALNCIRANMKNYLALSDEVAQLLAGLDGTLDAEQIRDSLLAQLREIPEPSLKAIQRAPDECRSIYDEMEDLKRRLAQTVEKCVETQEMVLQAKDFRVQAEEYLTTLETNLQEVHAKAKAKIDTIDFKDLHLDEEILAVQKADEEFRQKIVDTAQEAITTLSRCRDTQTALRGNFRVLEKACVLLAEKRNRLENGLAERASSPEQSPDSQVDSLSVAAQQTLEKLLLRENELLAWSPERFAKAAWETLRTRISLYQTAVSEGNFAFCANESPKLLQETAQFLSILTTSWHAFHDEVEITRMQLQAAREEWEAMQQQDTAKWTSSGKILQDLQRRLEECSAQLDEISLHGSSPEEFSPVKTSLIVITASLRDVLNQLTANRARFQERDGIRKAVMHALKELHYDRAEYYYEREKEDGSEDLLSDLTIYAHNPAGTGDMRLNVGLDGQLAFQIFRHNDVGQEQEVTRQDTFSCHQAVLNLGECLKSTGISLHVTDWGKASEIAIGQSDLESPPPAASPKQYQQEKTPAKAEELQREREKSFERI